jgi:hypothetical protein
MPTDIDSDLISLLLTSGVVHPWSHVSEANRYGYPARVDYRNLVETFPEIEDRRIDAAINGAGFSSQDALKNSLGGSARDSMAKANALYKAFYLAGGPSILGANTRYKGGDIEALKKSTGNKYIAPMLGASAISDALDAYNIIPDNHSLSFRMDEGTPMLMYNYRW